MEMSSTAIRVGSRESELALIQTNTVIEKLKKIHPQLQFEVVTMATLGDRILDKPLSKIGDESLFSRELEDCLLDQTVDIVVHSLKDLPPFLPNGLVIGCVLERDDPRDAVVMHPKHAGKTLDDLREGSVIGTSSLRRCAQIRRRYPHLKIRDIRGDLNVRLKKVDAGDDYDAMILAVAGLERMGWTDRMSSKLSADECMHAVGQGAVAVECRARDTYILDALSPLHHQQTALRCVMERAVIRRLGGDITIPAAVFTEIKDDTMSIRGGIYSPDGLKAVELSLQVSLSRSNDSPSKGERKISNTYCAIVCGKGGNSQHFMEAEKLGINLADHMMEQGGGEIIHDTQTKTDKMITY